MQAALMLRSKQRIARRKLQRQRLGIKGEIPCNMAPPTLSIPPFPRYPPTKEDFAVRRSNSFIVIIDFLPPFPLLTLFLLLSPPSTSSKSFSLSVLYFLKPLSFCVHLSCSFLWCAMCRFFIDFTAD